MKISNNGEWNSLREVKRTKTQIFYNDGSIGPTREAQEFMDSCGGSPRGAEMLRSVGLWNITRNDTVVEGEIPDCMKLTFLRSVDMQHVLDLKTKGRIYKRLWVKLRNPLNGKQNKEQARLRTH